MQLRISFAERLHVFRNSSSGNTLWKVCEIFLLLLLLLLNWNIANSTNNNRLITDLIVIFTTANIVQLQLRPPRYLCLCMACDTCHLLITKQICTTNCKNSITFSIFFPSIAFNWLEVIPLKTIKWRPRNGGIFKNFSSEHRIKPNKHYHDKSTMNFWLKIIAVMRW